MGAGLQTYSSSSNCQNLLDLIKDINPDGTPLSDLLAQKPKPKKPENELWKKLQILL